MPFSLKVFPELAISTDQTKCKCRRKIPTLPSSYLQVVCCKPPPCIVCSAKMSVSAADSDFNFNSTNYKLLAWYTVMMLELRSVVHETRVPRSAKSNMTTISDKHTSIFSYSLSRPFPFRWFTPGGTVGAIVFTALFSFLKFD